MRALERVVAEPGSRLLLVAVRHPPFDGGTLLQTTCRASPPIPHPLLTSTTPLSSHFPLPTSHVPRPTSHVPRPTSHVQRPTSNAQPPRRFTGKLGPPYSLESTDIAALAGEAWDVKLVGSEDRMPVEPSWGERGCSYFYEDVYLLTRR